MTSFNNNKKLEVVELDRLGYSARKISDLTGIARSTVTDFLRQDTHKAWWKKNSQQLDNEFGKKKEPIVYLLDIETSPIEAYVWNLYPTSISHNHIIKDWEILCVCYKRLGSNETIRLSTAAEYMPVAEAKKLGEPLTHKQMAHRLWKVLDEATVIVSHNGKKFDNRKIRAKLKQHGLPPPRPYKVYDTLKAARENFGFTSNRKDYLSKLFDGDGKLDTGGMQLWIDCLNGKLEAWEKMIPYCGVDVDELERIYMEIRAWDNKHPNLQLHFAGAEERCGTCGSTDLSPTDKLATTQTSAYETLVCNDCGATKRRRQNIRTKEQMKNTLVNVS